MCVSVCATSMANTINFFKMSIQTYISSICSMEEHLWLINISYMVHNLTTITPLPIKITYLNLTIIRKIAGLHWTAVEIGRFTKTTIIHRTKSTRRYASDSAVEQIPDIYSKTCLQGTPQNSPDKFPYILDLLNVSRPPFCKLTLG